MSHRTLIDAATLARHIGDPRWVLVDCRANLLDPPAGARAYAEGHLPGAVHASLDEDLAAAVGPETGRHPLPDPRRLAATLGAWGVGPGVQVVAYDDAGGAFAARLWWLLRWLGHDAVAVLDGGLGAWQAEGGALVRDAAARRQRDFVARPDDGGWLDVTALRHGLAAGDIVLVDARAAARFRGEVEPIDPVAGHVPGAVNLPMDGNLAADGRFLSPERLRERYLPLLDADASTARVVHMCGSGVTACHNLLAMTVALGDGGRLYAGSWSEWIRDPARPVAVGA